MLDDSGTGFEHHPRGQRTRRKRVQKRSRPTGDLWDFSKNDVSHHSLGRLRRYRIRRTLWIFQVIACLSLGLWIPYAAKWSYEKVVYANDSLTLTKLNIETSGTLSEDIIVEASGVRLGNNLASLDTLEIEGEISKVPEVESVEVIRQFPDTLQLIVTERVPVAWLSSPKHKIRALRDGGLLIDPGGVAFSCRKMKDELAALPTVEIRDIVRPVEGQKISSFQLVEALKLIRASRLIFNGHGMDIMDVRALGSWGLLCRYPENLLVTFDINRIEEGLLDLDEILKKSGKANLLLATVNLVTVKNIPVTFHSNAVPENW